MRGRLGLVLGVGAATALVLVVSLVSVSVAGPNVTRLAVIEHATTGTVVDHHEWRFDRRSAHVPQRIVR